MIVLEPDLPERLDGIPFASPGKRLIGIHPCEKPTTIGSHRFCQLHPLVLVFGQANITEAFLRALCPLRVQVREQPRWRDLGKQRSTRDASSLRRLPADGVCEWLPTQALNPFVACLAP